MYSPNQDSPAPPRTPYVTGGGAPLQAPPLAGSDNPVFDIAVIGGGVTGVSLALHAAEAGAKVVLLEAREIAWGASGRNSGHVPAATKLEPAEALRRYGPEKGMRLLDVVASGPDLVYGLVERHGIDAEVVRSGVISAACTPQAAETLKRRTAFWQERGAALQYLDQAATTRVTGSDRYWGCSVDPRGGTINPLAYVRGLARAALARGVSLHEGSPVTSCRRDGKTWEIATPGGSVRAGRVALCTHAFSDHLSPQLGTSIVPVRAYQFMTEPLPPELLRTILPGRQGLTDSRRLMSGIRVHASGGLLFSGLGNPFGPHEKANLGYSFGRIRRLFPSLAGIRLDYWWTGWMAANRENEWKLHEPAPGMITALGCNGRGLATGTILGREMAEHLRGKPAAELLLPLVPIRPIPLFALHPVLVNALVAYYRLRDALDDRLQAPARP